MPRRPPSPPPPRVLSFRPVFWSTFFSLLWAIAPLVPAPSSASFTRLLSPRDYGSNVLRALFLPSRFKELYFFLFFPGISLSEMAVLFLHSVTCCSPVRPCLMRSISTPPFPVFLAHDCCCSVSFQRTCSPHDH